MYIVICVPSLVEIAPGVPELFQNIHTYIHTYIFIYKIDRLTWLSLVNEKTELVSCLFPENTVVG
jgi:hypothetical protein